MKLRMFLCTSLIACLLLPVPLLGQEKGQADEEQTAGGVTLRDCIENLTLKGDMLIRYELLDLDNPAEPDETRDRIRTRFRLGFDWKSRGENWQLSAGLATGGPAATSTLDTWSEEE